MPRTALALSSVLVIGAIVTAGCGSSGAAGTSTASNGEASKSGAQVLSDARAATAAASSVHVTFSGISGSVTAATLDLSRGQGASGTITYKGQPVQIVVSGQTVYMKAPAPFWTQTTGSASTAAALADKWLKIPGSAAQTSVADLKGLTDMATLFSGMLNPSGAVTNAGSTTFQGAPAVKLTNSQEGALYVAATGAALPVGITEAASQGSGTGSFVKWNAPVVITVPAGAVSMPQG